MIDNHRWDMLVSCAELGSERSFSIDRSDMRILILGGTTEASTLARQLASESASIAPLAMTLSLAGRTRAPILPPVPCRIGGFGGIAGLIAWLRRDQTDLVIDATHPFAVQISANAVAATAHLGVPLITILRPAWEPMAGDQWLPAADAPAAAALLADPVFRGSFAQPTALLTMGRLDLAAFHHIRGWRLIVRAIDPPDRLPEGAELLLDRGPFDLAGELALLERTAATVIVTKNSGGAATAPKLVAARQLGLPVIMIARQPKPAGDAVHDVAAALAKHQLHYGTWLSARGV
jgi:precorrin-6A/cobalt-precorrin-6A reductase